MAPIRSSLRHSANTLENRNGVCACSTHLYEGWAESRSELGGSIVTMAEPAESLLSKDPTRSCRTNPAVRCRLLKSEMQPRPDSAQPCQSLFSVGHELHANPSRASCQTSGPSLRLTNARLPPLLCDRPAPQFGAEESSNIALWSREESRQVNCFAVAKPGNAGGRAGAWSGLGASRIRGFYHSLDGSQSSIGLPSGSLSHAKVPIEGYSSVFSITTPLLLRWLRTSPMFFTV